MSKQFEDARMPSLRDKIRDQALQAERDAKELERKELEDEEKKVVKKSVKK